MKTKAIEVISKNNAVFTEKEVGELKDTDILVNLSYSTISSGTEKFLLTGNCFPMRMGYSSSGIVEWVGKDVTSVKVGDRVVTRSGTYTKHLIRNEETVIKVPDNLPLDVASMSVIAGFPLAGVRKVKAQIGESGLVVGLGILGIFTVQFMRMSGIYPLIAADPNPERREMALRCGADFALDPTADDYIEQIRCITDNNMINAAVEVTGLGSAINQTLDCMAKFGRVSLLGCTRKSDFTVDFYKKIHLPGIELIGAHSGARPLKENFANYWTENEDIKTVLRLASGGRLKMRELINEVHSPKEANAVLARLAIDKNFPLCVQFDWTDIE